MILQPPCCSTATPEPLPHHPVTKAVAPTESGLNLSLRKTHLGPRPANHSHHLQLIVAPILPGVQCPDKEKWLHLQRSQSEVQFLSQFFFSSNQITTPDVLPSTFCIPPIFVIQTITRSPPPSLHLLNHHPSFSWPAMLTTSCLQLKMCKYSTCTCFGKIAKTKNCGH